MSATTIQLKCCECGKTVNATRGPEDPTNAVLMEDLCDECGSGGFSDPAYYDKDGNLIEQPYD